MGKRSSAGKTPPSNGVPSGPWISASQYRRSSSDTGPAVMPSGGLLVSARYSCRSRRWAVDCAMFEIAESPKELSSVLGEMGGFLSRS